MPILSRVSPLGQRSWRCSHTARTSRSHDRDRAWQSPGIPSDAEGTTESRPPPTRLRPRPPCPRDSCTAARADRSAESLRARRHTDSRAQAPRDAPPIPAGPHAKPRPPRAAPARGSAQQMGARRRQQRGAAGSRARDKSTGRRDVWHEMPEGRSDPAGSRQPGRGRAANAVPAGEAAREELRGALASADEAITMTTGDHGSPP